MTLQDKRSQMGTTKSHCSGNPSCPICLSSVLNLDPPDCLLPPSLHPSPPLPSVGIACSPPSFPGDFFSSPLYEVHRSLSGSWSIWNPSMQSISSLPMLFLGLIHIFWATSLLSLTIMEDGLEYKTGLMAGGGCPISLRPGWAYYTSAKAFRLHHSSASPGKLI